MEIKTPFTQETLSKLKAGDSVEITGIIYTARDAAHKRMVETCERGEKLPFNPEGQCIYYVGPTPPKPGEIIGSAGPTTSYRMDAYTPTMLDLGLMGMIGKGKRSPEVVEKMVEKGAVYFAAIGGAAALMKDKIKSAEIIAYEDLASEAVRKLWVEKFPVIVIIDSQGNNLYELGPKAYLESQQ